MRKLTIALACTVLIAVAVLGAIIFVKTAPKAERKRPPKIAAPVETQRLKAEDHTVVLKLTGTVVPAEDIVLRARVSGEIVEMAPNFIDGGRLERGALAVRIDPADYELAMADVESLLEKARFDYTLEIGRQDVAKREWELLKTDDASELEKELALRIPHLAASKAALKAAEASLERARLNLARTEVRAPFDAVVLERQVNIGSQASQQDALARLVGTDTYWVQVSVPIDRLEWIDIPGSTARVVSNSGAVREGVVIRLLGDLEEKGRMARLLVEVMDPLSILPKHRGKKPLLIEEFVRVEISGRRLDQVYTIPRYALRENSIIWLAENGKLDIREVEVLWRTADEVIVRDGLTDGELLIISDLTTPVQGMDINSGMQSEESLNTQAQTRTGGVE